MTHTTYSPPEARYGMPPADLILQNRQFTIGYSHWIKQPKWVLELIDAKSSIKEIDERSNAFRPDHRVPEIFRVKDTHYVGSGYDRGHLIASANRHNSEIANSETFLMTNMSPQLPSVNRGLWKTLEERVRQLAEEKSTLEVYSICGPVWAFGRAIESLDSGIEDNIIIPIPHFFFKCILTESNTGRFKFYAFLIPNQDNNTKLSDYYVTTSDIEAYTGLYLWDRLNGKYIDEKKANKYKLWFDD